jgi:hypothetical protein
MHRTFSLNRNADGTATFRAKLPERGEYIEHIDARNLGLLETYERFEYAAICAGLSLNPALLEELLREARGLLTN